MTHPTIEAAVREAAEWRGIDLGKLHPLDKEALTSDAKAAARVILSAPPSEVEIEAAGAAMYRIETRKSPGATYPEDTSAYNRRYWNAAARAALTAARAKHLEELEGR